jgi:hypothetical protein
LTIKKNILGLLLLLLLASPFFTTAYFLIKKQKLQSIYIERLEKKALHYFELKKTELVWVKKNKELVIQNRLLDIKEIIYQKDKVTVSGWFDEEEEQINKQAAKQATAKFPNQLVFMGYNYCEPLSFPYLKTFSVYIKLLFPKMEDPLFNTTLALLTPPPNNLV